MFESGGAPETMTKGGGITPRTYTCPFWKWDKGRAVSCESCRVNFPDDDAKQEYVEGYCASLNGWRDCSIAANLLTYYERTDGDA